MKAAQLHARQVLRDLQTAEGRLCNALAETADDTVARAIDGARKALRPGLRRSQEIVNHLNLKNAEEPELPLGDDANQGSKRHDDIS